MHTFSTSREIDRRQVLRSAAAVATLAALPAYAQENTLKVGGTGSGSGILAMLGAAFAAEKAGNGIRTQVAPALGTSGGIKAVAQSVLDMAIIGRPLKPDEAGAAGTPSALAMEAFGSTPFTVAVHQEVPGTAITLPQLVKLYTDPDAVWPDGQRVRVVLRPPDDGETLMLKSFSPNVAQAVDAARARQGMLIAANDRDAVDQIERARGGLGTSSLGLLLSEKRRARALVLEGREPSVAGIESGAYPYERTMYLVWRGTPSGPVAAFLAYLRTPTAQALMRANGFLPRPAAFRA
jgi:phosphate transport system substrate-binding protein